MSAGGKIIRAIDVGFGNTKYTTGYTESGKDIECKMFPLLAPYAAPGALDGFVADRDTVAVKAGDHTYEVGSDAMLAMRSNSTRSLISGVPAF